MNTAYNGSATSGCSLLIALLFSMVLAAPSNAAEIVPVERVIAGSPASAVARLNNGTGRYCSAVLIARDIAVTAAHCLYNFRTHRWVTAEAIHLLFGFNRGEYKFHSRAKTYLPGGFDPQRTQETGSSDWALIRLEENAPAEFAILPQAGAAAEASEGFRAFGFASPRQYLLQQLTGCDVLGERSGYLLSKCPGVHGMSGGPLIDEASGTLIGIQTGMAGSGSGEMLLAIPVSAWVEAAKNF